MPLKRIRSLTYRWLHVLQPELISNMFSSGSGTTSLCEAIEMQPLVMVRTVEAGQQGSGHQWSEVGTHNPAYCDQCGELIWGLYDTGAWQCDNCNYTAHIKCRDMVRLDCSVKHLEQELTLAEEVSNKRDQDQGNIHLTSLQDDTDGMVQSLPSDDDEEELSFSSYATAKGDPTVSSRTLVVSETSDTLVGDEQFHTLQDGEV